jgi:IS605 OrfB family transposase
MSIMLRTHRGWVELRYRNNKQLYRYLYSGWRLSSELKLESNGRRVIAYLAFSRSFEITYDPSNVVSLDVNENNVTIVVFRDDFLAGIIRVETSLGRIIIAYSVERERISRRRSTSGRDVRRKLRKLRERDRKRDILYKVASIIEDLARENKTVVVIGDIDGDDKERMESDKDGRLMHRIISGVYLSRESFSRIGLYTLLKYLKRGPLSVDPFSMKRIDGYSPLVIRSAVRGANGRYKVVKIVLRIAYVDSKVVERDIVGAINIGLKYLSSDKRPVALGSTGAHAARVKPVIPSLGPTPLTEIKLFTDIIRYR